MFKNNLKNYNSKIAKEIKRKFNCKPVSINLIFEDDELRGEIHPLPKICIAIIKAQNSDFILPVSSLTCPVARYVLGSEEKNKVIKILYEKRLVASKKAAKKLVSKISCFKGNLFGIRLSPLEKAKANPDVVVFVTTPKTAMLIAQTLAYNGNIVNAEFNGITASCSEIIAIPVKYGKPNFSLGCRGSRNVLNDDEVLFAIPGNLIHILTDVEVV
ncbi:MAG: DUF169 domain-containing protein [Archaeoglobaceae archaeon]|nr:DUF169 domain-containing protein [Archaeoglobaceae archaeon]